MSCPVSVANCAVNAEFFCACDFRERDFLPVPGVEVSFGSVIAPAKGLGDWERDWIVGRCLVINATYVVKDLSDKSGYCMSYCMLYAPSSGS